MPVLMSCPSCDSKVKVPDQLAGSGKTLKCPKCQGKIALANSAKPAELDEEPVPRKRPRDDDNYDENDRGSKKRRRDDDDEPVSKKRSRDDDYDDEPAPKKRRRDEDDDEPETRTRKADLKESRLFGESDWMLRRKKSLLFAKMKPIRCEIFRPGSDDKMIGVVEERCNKVLKALFGGVPIIGPLLSTNFDVRDGDNDPNLFTVRVPGLSFKLSLMSVLGIKERKVEVLDEKGKYVCQISMKFFTLTPKFNVYDPDGETMAQFNFKMPDMKKFLPARMILTTVDGEEWGTVTGQDDVEAMQVAKAGKAKFKVQFMPKAPGLIINVNPDIADQNAAKRLLLAAAVAMKIFGADTVFNQGQKQ
jgi:hypothetical protein